MVTWAFIYISKGCDPEKHTSVIESPGCRTLIYGVDSIDAGHKLAKKIVDEGVKLIELCGGFGEKGAKEMIDKINGRVPVSYVTYFPGESERIRTIFNPDLNN